MNHYLLKPQLAILQVITPLILAAAAPVSAGTPVATSPHDHPAVKKIKVKGHKVKVKVRGGKAKIKDKAHGGQKVKVKGRNGDLAASIAEQVRRDRGYRGK